ncbi:MAG: HEAT repeat domain-containing protein, partial [Planctomycetota bacterium]
MARRRSVTQQDVAALARRAVDAVADAQDMEATAERILRKSASRGVSQAIVELSLTASDEVASALIGAAVRGQDAELARTAADILFNLEDGAHAHQVLRECLHSEDEMVRRRAAEALASFSAPAVAELLPEALLDEDDSVRRAAIGAIGLIVGVAHHPLRGPILEGLADTTGPLHEAVVRNSDIQVRRQAAQSFAFVESESVLPALEALCRDEDPEVRQEAALCLAAMGTPAAVELMRRMLEDASGQVASAVLDALAARLGAGSVEFLQCLSRAVQHPVPEVRRHAVLMLARFEADQATPVLEAATSDPDFEVARHAGELLRKLRPEAGLDWL